jgi:two-component system, cell cycle sensor histidine kinase and response regulator CckA
MVRETGWFAGVTGATGTRSRRCYRMFTGRPATPDDTPAVTGVAPSGKARRPEVVSRSVTVDEPAVLLLVVESNRIRRASEASERVTGYTPDDLLGMEWPALFHGESRPDVAPLAGREGLTEACDVRLARKDGTVLPCRLHAMGWNSASGPTLVVALADSTSDRAAGSRVRQVEREESIGRLAGGVAHDFNNLLTVILGQTGLLLAQLEPATAAAQCAESIRATADRAAVLVGELLSSGRRQHLAPGAFDLNELVSQGARQWSPLLGPTHDIVLRLARAGPPVFADRGRVLEALLNLVINARDAMSRGGAIVIETCQAALDEDFVARHPGAAAGQYGMVAVTDNGCGLCAEARERLFEPFFTTKGPGKGTGLGLASVYGTVKQSGGSIWVYSEPGRGTTFKVYLPAPRGTVTTGPAGAAEADPGRTILVVDDDHLARAFAASVLRRAGHVPLEADGTEAALGALIAHPGPIHLLLTDMTLPGHGSVALVHEVRQQRPGTPVLLMSGFPEQALLLQQRIQDGAAFISKPFSGQDLKQAIRRVLDAGQACAEGKRADHAS